MSKRSPRKHSICRRQMAAVCGSPTCPVHTKNYTQGQHGPAGRAGIMSDFGKQLRAKQQLKKHYGDLTEKQFKRIYEEAVRRRGDTSEDLIGLLESRLDAIIFRANFVPSMFAARQFVSHKHIKVTTTKKDKNGEPVTTTRIINIPSYRVQVGDVVEIKDKSRQITMVLEAEKNAGQTPAYLEVDNKKKSVKFLAMPTISDVPYPVMMEPNLVIEFYSR